MASRRFNQFFYSLISKPVKLFMNVTVGATGAPTLVAANSKGIASITRTSAGLYVITLQDQYMKLLAVNAMMLKVTAEDITVQVSAINLTAKTVTIFTKAAAVATDPTSGSQMYLEFTMSNSSID